MNLKNILANILLPKLPDENSSDVLNEGIAIFEQARARISHGVQLAEQELKLEIKAKEQAERRFKRLQEESDAKQADLAKKIAQNSKAVRNIGELLGE